LTSDPVKGLVWIPSVFPHFWITTPVIFMKNALNNAGFILKGHQDWWFPPCVLLKNEPFFHEYDFYSE
jgi:hypothetical protein